MFLNFNKNYIISCNDIDKGTRGIEFLYVPMYKCPQSYFKFKVIIINDVLYLLNLSAMIILILIYLLNYKTTRQTKSNNLK